MKLLLEGGNNHLKLKSPKHVLKLFRPSVWFNRFQPFRLVQKSLVMYSKSMFYVFFFQSNHNLINHKRFPRRIFSYATDFSILGCTFAIKLNCNHFFVPFLSKHQHFLSSSSSFLLINNLKLFSNNNLFVYIFNIIKIKMQSQVLKKYKQKDVQTIYDHSLNWFCKYTTTTTL